MYCHDVPKSTQPNFGQAKVSSFAHFCLNFLPEFYFQIVAVPPTEISNDTLKFQP